MTLPYDQTDPKDIEKYGKRLLNRTLRSTPGALIAPPELFDPKMGGRNRSSFGFLLEEFYYGIKPGNDSNPDFKEAGVELKSTPIKSLSKGGYSAKERLVLNIINYRNEAVLNFENSSYFRKNARIMLVSYLHKKDCSVGDYPIKVANLLEFKNLPLEDRLIIQDDWNKINKKIKEGRAHELSEGDTLYLGACTKASNSNSRTPQYNNILPAKPRAYSLKSGYMTMLTRRLIAPETLSDTSPVIKNPAELKEKTFEEIVSEKFKPFVGMKVSEIHSSLAIDLNIKAKGYYAALARRMMGVKTLKIEELEKANIDIKTVRLQLNGVPRESMSFPAFKYKELIEEEWEQSSLVEQLERRFMFVVYQYNLDEELIFKGIKFWSMPAEDIDKDVKFIWEKTFENIKESRSTALPGERLDRIAHVRPHAKNKKDMNELPDGTFDTKKSFWLNRKYIAKILSDIAG